MNGLRAAWYVNGIPLYCIDTEPFRPDEWQDTSLTEVVHYKGSDGQGAVHANGFSPESIDGLPVMVHESNHLAVKALRQQNVAWIRVSDNEERTVVLLEYQARRVRGQCWYQGTISLVDV